VLHSFVAYCDHVLKYNTINYQQNTLIKVYLLKIPNVSEVRHRRGHKSVLQFIVISCISFSFCFYISSYTVSIGTNLIPDDGGPPKHAGPLINTFLIVYCVGIL